MAATKVAANRTKAIADSEAYAIFYQSLGLCGVGSALARFVLIDKKNRICGDTAALSLRSREWADIAAQNNNVEELAIRAARLLDKNCGQTCRAYEFVPFAGNDDADGYFIFDCNGDRAPPAICEVAYDPEATASVMTACFYRGFVRCRY